MVRRTRIALILFLFFCVFSSARMLVWEIKHKRKPAGMDRISRDCRRFDQLALDVPQNVQSLVYVQPGNPSFDKWSRDYFTARYALAPLELKSYCESDWSIYDCGSDESARLSPPPSGQVVLRDYGNGVLLLHRREQ